MRNGGDELQFVLVGKDNMSIFLFAHHPNSRAGRLDSWSIALGTQNIFLAPVIFQDPCANNSVEGEIQMALITKDINQTDD